MHRERNLKCVVYDDNFATLGPNNQLDWFENKGEIEAKYAISERGRMGPGKDDTKEAILLNCVIRWVDGFGIEVETDPRQGERLVT